VATEVAVGAGVGGNDTSPLRPRGMRVQSLLLPSGGLELPGCTTGGLGSGRVSHHHPSLHAQAQAAAAAAAAQLTRAPSPGWERRVCDILGRLLAHCARAAPFVGAAGGAGRPGRSGEDAAGWSRVNDVEDTSRLFATAWEARAAAAMLAWFVDTEGFDSSTSSSSGTPVSAPVLDDVLRVLGVSEDGGDPSGLLPVRAMMSLRREATAAWGGLQLDPSLRRNLLLPDE